MTEHSAWRARAANLETAHGRKTPHLVVREQAPYQSVRFSGKVTT
jgi:hypothetical protein